MTLNISVSEIVNKSNNPLLGKHKSWGRVLLHEIAKVQNGFAFNSNHFEKDGGLPLIRIRDIGKDVTETQYTGDYDPTYLVTAGDFLVGMDGDFNCSRWRGPKGLLNQRVCKIALLSEYFLSKFFDYAFPAYLKAINDLTSSVTVKHLSSKSVEAIPLPLPPLNEQKRIVAEIGKQFSRLDEAVASLKQAKANLKRYKAAVLKAAVEGKLTEQWRKEHPDVEPAEKLLQRILAERRAKWEKTQINKMRANSNPPKKDKWQRRYNEPISPNLSELPPLPKRWTWASVDQLADGTPNSITDGPFGSNLKTVHYTQSGPRVIRLQNIGDTEFINEKAHITEEHFNRLMKHSVEAGNVIIAALGRPAPRACLIPDWLGKAIVKADCVRFRPHHGYLESAYLMYALNSDSIQSRTEKIVHGIGRPRLNLGEIKSIPLPIPPKIEQKKILQEIEQTLSMIRKIEEQLETNFERAERLRQSILKKAFSGKLVPQDPNDEPAAVLLERIRSQKERQKGKGAGDKIP